MESTPSNFHPAMVLKFPWFKLQEMTGQALSRLQRLEVREEEGVLDEILELQNLLSNY